MYAYKYLVKRIYHLSNGCSFSTKKANNSCHQWLAKLYGIPQELLAKILQKLSKKRIVQAVKGPQGGYKLSSDPNKINMTNFFEIMEGPMGIMDCYFDTQCEQLKSCTIREPINRINENIRSMFNKK